MTIAQLTQSEAIRYTFKYEIERETNKLKILTNAVKSLEATDKQILAACKPKLDYYATMNKTDRRTCLWCQWSTEQERYQQHGPYIPEPIQQIETHYMEIHA